MAVVHVGGSLSGTTPPVKHMTMGVGGPSTESGGAMKDLMTKTGSLRPKSQRESELLGVVQTLLNGQETLAMENLRLGEVNRELAMEVVKERTKSLNASN
eukprot:CAMPEP_0175039398 /NCGR_PEP_ID=MMETSP0052_2-20121109/553_1 /TAXON_ID=51329 ORGANISM="Polytomella parva, Strain SAG 63-3" /NCGR_SAMPLE_ID=MMETSP0052_2 /ASSEMBLY_ACC=CAM_ASM_000194 /LENGTH=99 /DNA_ID=CAMNT_0016301229 /DNA_START=63 /DNA_END=362 /DNA_ORIENTATION=+